MLTSVKDDLFEIAKRLRFVNRDYCLFWNNKAQRYEVHNGHRPGFIVPYNELDERTIEYAHKTKIENFDALEKEFQLHNEELEQSAEKQLAQSASLLGDMLKYAAGQIHEVVFCKNSKWI